MEGLVGLPVVIDELTLSDSVLIANRLGFLLFSLTLEVSHGLTERRYNLGGRGRMIVVRLLDELLELADFGLEDQVGSLQILDVLVLSLHQENLFLELRLHLLTELLGFLVSVTSCCCCC